jgi:hypothetical protein
MSQIFSCTNSKKKKFMVTKNGKRTSFCPTPLYYSCWIRDENKIRIRDPGSAKLNFPFTLCINWFFVRAEFFFYFPFYFYMIVFMNVF